ncbi:MAG: response regulator transcription factor [Desulfobacterales bacterium]|nr:response regulator transcription factor [Desulfobacterales bacterium]
MTQSVNPNPPSPTVYVVDDDAAVRKALARLLKSTGYRARDFASAEAFLHDWKDDPAPGCLLLDISMPGLDGLQLQHRLNASKHTIPVIFITGHGDIPSTVSAMKAGAVDFLAKPLNDADLLKAVDEALGRDRRQRRERTEREALARRFQSLTPREREVMALVVGGLPNKQIAFDLGASEKTVKIHRGRVMEKMKAHSVADLVRAAQKIGIRPGAAPESRERRAKPR